MLTKPYHLLVEYPLCGVNHPTSLTCTVEIIWKQGEDAISKLFEDEQQSPSLEKDQIMITNTKKYERMKFIYEKEMPTEEQVLKEKDEIAGTESEEEGMSNSSEMEGKNEQEKREVNEQERREEDGDRDIIMIRGREADSEEESEEEGKRDGSVTVKVPLEGGKIEEMSFGMSEEAWAWLGDLPTKFRWVEAGIERT